MDKRKKLILVVTWAVMILLSAVILLHNNPLEDPDTARLKKICGCLLIGFAAVLITALYDKVSTYEG